MKLQSIFTHVGLTAALITIGLSGCGGSKSTTNQVLVSVNPPGGTMVLNQSFQFTANVTGATDTSVVWTCTFTFTTTNVDAKGAQTSTTSKAAPCPSDNSWGKLTDTTTTTLTYTAPSKLPTVTPPTPPAGSTAFITAYSVILTATANADKKKSGSATITLDSGIRVTLTPATATLAVGVDTQKFTASNPNDPTAAMNWFVTQKPTTQPAGTSFSPTPASAPCAAATCGTVDPVTGIYTPPATLPTDNIVYVVVNSKTDTARFAFSTITLTKVPTGGVTFDGIVPDKAPWGGQVQDIYLIAKNLRASSQITVVGTTSTPVDPSQIAVVPLPASFCTPSTTVTCPDISHVTRVRLNAANLSSRSAPGDISITVAGVGTHILHLVQTKPVIAEAIPDSFPQGATFSPSVNTFDINGGYFGAGGTSVKATLNGSSMAIENNSTARQLILNLSNTTIPNPGLYPVVVTSNPSGSTPPFPMAATNVAIQPTSFNTAMLNLPLPADSFPSAIAVDSSLGYAAVTEAGANQVQIFDLSTGTPVLVASSPVGSRPTGIAIDNQLEPDPGNHLAVVANNGDGSLSFIEIPSGKNLGTLVVSTPGSVAPYAVGIDPFSHLALVALNDTNSGLVIQLGGPNANAGNCLSGFPGPIFCPIASASIETGATPQIAFEPSVHLAYVSPGGRGAFSLVDLSQRSTTANIAPAPGGAVRSNNVVTITTVTPHNIDPILGGSVLISGLPTDTTLSFNGAFHVLASGVIDSRTFAFSQAGPNESTGSTSTNQGVVGAAASAPTLNVTSTAVGISINPESHVAAFADPNATTSQIGFINSLDERLANSLSLSVGSFGTTAGGAPESGARFVAYQPYYNVVVSFNPTRNEISFLDPVRLDRIIPAAPTGQTGIGQLPIPTTPPTTPPTTMPIYGALAVDPRTNLVLVANAGSNSLTYFNMNTGSQQAVQISEIVPAQTSFGVPNSFLAQATLSTTSTPGPVAAAQFRILGKGFTGATQVRLNQIAIPSFTVVADNEIDFTLPGPSQMFPAIYAVDVTKGTEHSNVTQLIVVGSAGLTTSGCANPAPAGVAIDEQRDVALVVNSGCSVAGTNATVSPATAITNAGTVSIIDINPLGTTYGTVLSTIPVMVNPIDVAVIPRLGFAVVTNQTSGTISLLDIHDPTNPTKVQDVTVGTTPSGVAIDQDTGLIIVANTGDNTISTIDLNVLDQKPTAGKLTATRIAVDSTPMAVAVDPARQIAVVSALQSGGLGGSTFGVLDVIDLSGATPVKSNTRSVSGLTALPTGLVLDPAVTPALFYATSSLANAIYTFNPDTGQSSQIPVGQGPTSIAYNPNSSELLTVNSKNNTISIVDTQTFRTTATLGIGSQSQFAAAIHSRTNLAVISDQANNRVLLFPLPK